MKIAAITPYAYRTSFRAEEAKAQEAKTYPAPQADPDNDKYVYGLYLPDGTVNGAKWEEVYGRGA